MKKAFKTPQLKCVLLEDSDLICTSNNIGGPVGGEGEPGGRDAARQRNPIWDDYE